MSVDSDDERSIAGIRSALHDAASRLAAAGARDEALAVFIPARRRLAVFTKRATMVPKGRVWRLGVFLLGHDETLYATGATTRAVAPGHPGYQSLSAENRREQRAAAFRGPFARGETVNFDAAPIELEADGIRSSSGPLVLRGRAAVVRWSPTAGDDTAMPFDAYLSERVDLLINPPEGA